MAVSSRAASTSFQKKSAASKANADRPPSRASASVFSRRGSYYSEIIPKRSPEIKATAKFSLAETMILSQSDGENSLLDLFKNLDLSEKELMSAFYHLSNGNLIDIQGYNVYQIDCPECKTASYYLIPSQLLQTSPCGYVRLQARSPLCRHEFSALIEKNGKVIK